MYLHSCLLSWWISPIGTPLLTCKQTAPSALWLSVPWEPNRQVVSNHTLPIKPSSARSRWALEALLRSFNRVHQSTALHTRLRTYHHKLNQSLHLSAYC